MSAPVPAAEQGTRARQRPPPPNLNLLRVDVGTFGTTILRSSSTTREWLPVVATS